MIAILEKDGQFAAIGRQEIEQPGMLEPAGVVGIFDERQQRPLWREGFEVMDKAVEAFNKALSTSKAREWTVAYHGPALNNPTNS